MANTPKKAKDPTEAAMSAIQDALNVRDADMKAASRAPAGMAAADGRDNVAEQPRPVTRLAPPLAENELFSGQRPAADEQPRRPANDDWQSVGKILQNLQPRANRRFYLVATGCALLWLIAGAALTAIYLPELRAFGEGQAFVPALLVGAALIVPVILFFGIAHMMVRSRELRLLAQSMTEVALRLAEPEAVARESIITVGQAIRREVAAMGDGVERALARAAELEALVHNEVSALERAYNDNEVRIRGLLEDLAHQRNNLVGQAKQVHDAITSVHHNLTQDITLVSEVVSEKVHASAQEITRSLAEKGEHITVALGRAGDSMIDALGERGGDLLERLENTSRETTHAIGTATDRLTTSLDFKTNNITHDFEDLAKNLMQMMQLRLANVSNDFAQRSTSIVEMMGDRAQLMTDTLLDSTSRIAETIATRGDEVNSTLKATADSLVLDLNLRGNDVVSQLEQTGALITDNIVARSTDVMNSFRENADALAATVGSRGEAVSDMLASRLRGFEQMFTHGGSELAERISHDSTTLGNLITRHLGEFDRTVKTYGGELVERLGERTQQISESMRSYVDNFDERVSAKTQEVTSVFDQRLSRFQNDVDTRTQTFNEVLGSRVMDIAKTLAESGKEVVAALDKRINEVTATINVRGAKLAESIGAKIEEIDLALGSRATEVANNLDNRIGRFEELLIGRAEGVTEQIELRTRAAADALYLRMEQFAEAIKDNTVEAERSIGSLTQSTTELMRHSTQEIERSLTGVTEGMAATLRLSAGEVEHTLLGASAEAARSFVGKAEEIASTVSQRAAEMTLILDTSSSTLLNALTSKSQQFTGDVSRATEQAVRAIEAKGYDFTKTMLDNSDELARIINKAGETATHSVSTTLDRLQQTAKSAVEQSQQTTSAAVTEMLETHNMLRSDTTGLFERMREANILLQEVLSSAQENMGTLEKSLTGKLSDFVSSMHEVTERSGTAADRVSAHVTAFHRETSRALEDLSELAAQFESQGRVLVQAVDLIDQSNRRSDEAVNERRANIDSLIATLDIKTDDLEQRLKRFSSLLDDSLESAAGRAREIGRLIAESSAEGARSINEQFETVRSAAEAERERTAESLQQIYVQAMGDTNAMFRNSHDRFTEVVQGIRQMAGEMQQELDSTRAQLRRGIMELPQETAESTAQMRRVIVDQIEALHELNRIVSRHGRGIDAAEARRTPREEPALTLAGGGTSPRLQPRREPPPSSPPPPPAPAPRRLESPPPAPASAQNNRGGGWLTDLLQRASRGDESQSTARAEERGSRQEDRQPRHTIESLDALSVDIARMIDHDAASELWDRYNRGERNVFTRKLYTLQGQQAFDEIRARYRNDREFKQTVDRYVAEFERLLEDVSRDDRGQVLVRTYLTSETGKVYTMLAHASGRFE